jgi:hypothetical protein
VSSSGEHRVSDRCNLKEELAMSQERDAAEAEILVPADSVFGPDAEVALGCESAHPALQIERWLESPAPFGSFEA